MPRPFEELRGPHDALDRPPAALLPARRVRRTPECVLQAAQAILPDAADALVTTEDAFVVLADTRVCPAGVRHAAAAALVTVESVR